MPETMENVESVEIQDTANGANWLVPAIAGAVAYALIEQLGRVARKKYEELRQKHASKKAEKQDPDVNPDVLVMSDTTK